MSAKKIKNWITEYWMPVLGILCAASALVLIGVLAKRMQHGQYLNDRADEINRCLKHIEQCDAHLPQEGSPRTMAQFWHYQKGLESCNSALRCYQEAE